jgi:hypothetical protein
VQVAAHVVDISGDDLVSAVTAELEAAGSRSSALGVTAIVLAQQMSGRSLVVRLSRRCRKNSGR